MSSAALQLPASDRSRVRAFLDLVRFEHSVFALPFAYIASLTAMVGIINGINGYVYHAFGSVGSDLIYVTKTDWAFRLGPHNPALLQSLARRPDLTSGDARALAALPLSDRA